MPVTLRFQLTDESRKAMSASLDPRQYSQAIFQVVKRTTIKVARIVQDKVRDESTISSKYVKRVIAIIKPKGNPPEGQVIVKKERIPLAAFRYTSSRHNGVKVIISKSLPPVILKHGFVADMKSGHRGIFMRAQRPGKIRIGRNGRQMKLMTLSGFSQRLPIEERFGPSIYKIVSVPSVIGDIRFDSDAYMAEQAKSQIARFANRQPIVDAPDGASE